MQAPAATAAGLVYTLVSWVGLSGAPALGELAPSPGPICTLPQGYTRVLPVRELLPVHELLCLSHPVWPAKELCMKSIESSMRI